MHASECTALIMAGGRSARMRRSGCATHKSLRVVRGVPLIEWNIATLLWFGFREIFIALSADENELANWIVGPGSELTRANGADLKTIVEEAPLGTIGAACFLPGSMKHALVVNVDNLTDLSLSRFASFHLNSGAAATVATHLEPFRIPFGRLEIADDTVLNYDEKPEICVQISSGTYMLARSAVDDIAAASHADVPQLITSLIARGEGVAAYQHSGQWLDINDEQSLAKAEALLRRRSSSWPGFALVRNLDV